jgi:hypothetical protein
LKLQQLGRLKIATTLGILRGPSLMAMSLKPILVGLGDPLLQLPSLDFIWVPRPAETTLFKPREPAVFKPSQKVD